MTKKQNIITKFILEKFNAIVKTRLWIQILVAMVLGVVLGVIISPHGFALMEKENAETLTKWLLVPGLIFFSMIKMIMLPLVISSIILGVASKGNPADVSFMGLRTALYFVVTTTIAVTIGVLLSLIIKPGNYINDEVISLTSSAKDLVSQIDIEQSVHSATFYEQITTLIPTNLVESVLNQNILQVIIFAIFIGVALASIKKNHSKPILVITESVQELSMVIVRWAMFFAPMAVFGFLTKITMKIGFDALLGMSAYVITVLLGLILLLTFYLTIVTIFGKMKPLDFLTKVKEVQLLAFSTSSSAATMPFSIRAAVTKLRVRPQTANFIIPIGTTINMDGTAIYQVIATIFLTQVFGIDLSFLELITLIITTVAASIGTPGTPGVGIIILATILSNVGVPISGIAIIIGVDRILDMARTAVNVTGDLTACVILDRVFQKRKK